MPTNIRYIENGEEVVEQVLNRPVEDVESNLDTLFLEGIPFWSSSVTYDANSLVQENGVVYRGTAQSINALPSASPSYWVRWEGNRQATLNDRGTVTISDSLTSTSTTTAASSEAARSLQSNIESVQAINITGGNGLTGGGDLSANRTISMGTPSTLSGTTTNSTTSNGHSHAVDATNSRTNTSNSTLLTAAGMNDHRTSGDHDHRYYTQPEVDAMLDAAGFTPLGGIIMWSGSIASIPTKWALCNGANGTPDLRNRFVVGAGDQYAVGNTGGASSVTLTESQIPSHTHTASSGNAGGHSHTASTGSSGYHGHTGSTNTTGSHTHGVNSSYDDSLTSEWGVPRATRPYDGFRTQAAGNHSHTLSINGNGSHTHSVSVSTVSDHSHTVTVNSTGGNGSHENRPPYYALAYIMRVS